MKKRTRGIKGTLSVFLAASMLLTGLPVYGQEEFGAGSEEIQEVQEAPVFADGENTFTSEESTEFQFSSEEDFEEGFLSEAQEEEIHYIKGRPLTEEERAQEFAPFGTLTDLGDAPIIGSELDVAPYALYPSRYDARTQGLVTGAKNQHPFGICWAFGMASILETSFLAQNKGNIDLSEEHLAYFFSNRENDPLNNTAGDYNYNKQGYHNGGNTCLASIFLTTWSGMTTEKSVPLPTDLGHTDDNSMPLPPSKAYETAAYLTNASFSDYSVDRLKQMVYEDSSAAIMYYMDSAYYNADTGGYSYPEPHGINHVVTVVGWDDTYSKKNFPENCGVENDGAWIVKNSWGSQWGEDGYFYLSYEDKTIGGLVSARATEKPDYPNNYFYDGSSGLKTISLKQGQSLGNIFTAKAKKGCVEAIGEVNVITYSDNAHYTVQIYTDLKDPANPVSGNKAYSKPVEVYQNLAGVKTIKVPEVKVAYGTEYSVVVSNAGSENTKFCVEGDTEHNNWFVGHAEVKKGQGFFGATTGVWTDMASVSATPRIKAHTRTINTTKAPVVQAISRSYSKIAVLWDKVEGVTGYTIYRSEAGKKATKIADLSADAVSYPDRKVTTGVKYTYTVEPYIKVSQKVIKGTKSKAVTAAPRLEVPVFQVKASEKGYNTITWKKISGATEYQIYRKAPGGKLKQLTTVKSSVLKYNDKKVTPCASYIYMVRAKRGTALSKYTTSDVIKAAPALQKVSSVTGSSSGIRIKWRSQENCDGYKLYRKTKSGSWTLIKTLPYERSSSYLDKKASKGVSYYYAVKAYVQEPYGTLYSQYTPSSAVKRK